MWYTLSMESADTASATLSDEEAAWDFLIRSIDGDRIRGMGLRPTPMRPRS